MTVSAYVTFVCSVALGSALGADSPDFQARQLESKGDAMSARVLLQRAARNSPGDIASLAAYAEFLDRYGDPETKDAYEKLLTALERSPDNARQAAVLRRLVVLDLLEGDRAGASRRLEQYKGLGGAGWDGVIAADKTAPEADDVAVIEIPGPLTSFSRMAALSPDISPKDVLPALARNVVTNGYQASVSSEGLEPTEYMKLLTRYLSQARELERLAGERQTIHIETCESPQTADLLRVLGYRMRGGCGGELVLETVNATRAFLTIDSGFPIAQFEQALRTSRPFTYDYKPARVSVLYGADYWQSAKDKQGEFIDVFLGDPTLCRLYLGFSKLDRDTAQALRTAVPVQRLRPFSHVLDFFGGMFEIRDGKAVVPGAPRSTQVWTELVGASPDQGAAFFDKLITKDDGWMASLFDALARINGPLKDYLTDPARLKRFYSAVRGRVTSPGPARPVFRSNTDMMLLTTRLRLEPDGRPHIPGGIEIWKNLFINHPHGKYDSKLTRAAPNWKEPDDVLEALFGLCRKSVENEPLKIFMALTDLNRRRAKPLEPATVDRLARAYRFFGSQYSTFSESPVLSDATILRYLDTAESITRSGDTQFRADAAGMLQSLAGLWQILVRQNTIPEAQADEAFASVIAPFAGAKDNRQLFDAGRGGVKALLAAAQADGGTPQEKMYGLLAGTAHPADPDSHAQVQQEMIRIFEAQRLISLNTFAAMADALESPKPDIAALKKLAARVTEIQLPRLSLSGQERTAISFGYWTERHIDAERKTNLRAAIDRAAGDPEKLKEIRGLLAPFLRDTLVGLNYIHYAPPAAQLLLTNPLFVRSHDFVGIMGNNQTWKSTEVLSTGWPSNAGGRLVGSLSGLPYALAEAEQNFMVPVKEQALIWGDLVPQMILSAKIPRWWNVTPAQMHWVGLRMRHGEDLLAEAALNSKLRREVGEILGRQASPGRQRLIIRLLERGDAKTALENVTPAELVVLSSEAMDANPEGDTLLSGEIRKLEKEQQDAVNPRAISRAFGTPKPTLTNSFQPELLYLRTFPTLMGYSSRIMAESWESPILYWAAIADEVHIPPSQLNVLIPEWTQKTVERIFATHLEDWPAVLRSLRLVGEDVRLKQRIQMDTDQKASLQ